MAAHRKRVTVWFRFTLYGRRIFLRQRFRNLLAVSFQFHFQLIIKTIFHLLGIYASQKNPALMARHLKKPPFYILTTHHWRKPPKYCDNRTHCPGNSLNKTSKYARVGSFLQCASQSGFCFSGYGSLIINPSAWKNFTLKCPLRSHRPLRHFCDANRRSYTHQICSIIYRGFQKKGYPS